VVNPNTDGPCCQDADAHSSVLSLTILKARDRPRLIQFVSLPLAFSYVVRPTSAIPIVLLTGYVLVWHRRYAVRYLLWALPVAVQFVLFTWSIYHSALAPYYVAGRMGQGAHFLQVPARESQQPTPWAVVFSPVILLSVYGAWLSSGMTANHWTGS